MVDENKLNQLVGKILESWAISVSGYI